MTDKYLEQDELDRLITRELSCLPFYAPSRGFQGRVLGQVRRPEPRALVAMQRAKAWVLQPRRALALAGAYAACAAIALGFAVPWVLQQMPSISYGAGLVADKLVGAGRELGLALAGSVLTSRSYETLRSLPILREHAASLAALLTVAYTAAAVALHRLLKSPGGKRVLVSTAQ
ncbi:MAG: hypothetical protein AAB409_07150 [Gemmatimonadota bacterium]|mgnify:CR=1 FL=1